MFGFLLFLIIIFIIRKTVKDKVFRNMLIIMVSIGTMAILLSSSIVWVIIISIIIIKCFFNVFRK